MSSTSASRSAARRGRPPCCPPEVVTLVVALRRRGLSLTAIGAELNTQGIPTPAGRSRWTKSHVDRLLHTRHAQDLLDGWSRLCNPE